jgi:DNA-binding NtrC family response regulator
VGSDRYERSDAWVIVAANHDLRLCVQQGTFRADLLYRLEVVRIDLPPLYDRGDDVELLAHHFLPKAELPYEFTPDALDAMRRYAWPGNVRELKNRVERAALLCNGATITAATLGLSPCGHDVTDRARTPIITGELLERLLWDMLDRRGASLTAFLKDCERRLIARALQTTNGNRSAAARRLGINVRTLFKKLRILQLPLLETSVPSMNEPLEVGERATTKTTAGATDLSDLLASGADPAIAGK